MDALPSLPRKELLILELLVGGGPMHGLRLVEESQGKLKRGTVYVTLGRMETKGFLVSEQEPPHPAAIGLPRRIYKVTALGERMYTAWHNFKKELAWEKQ